MNERRLEQNVLAYRKRLHESFRSRLGDSTQVVHQVGLGHADTGVLQDESLVGGVRHDLDVQLLARV